MIDIRNLFGFSWGNPTSFAVNIHSDDNAMSHRVAYFVCVSYVHVALQ